MPPSRPPGDGPGGSAPALPASAEAALNRKLIRPSLARQPTARPEERRQRARHVPPEATGLEAAHYAKQVNLRTRLVVTLESGDEVRGILDWHDQATLHLCRDDGPDLVIMKRAIVHTRRDDARGPTPAPRAPSAK